MNFLTTLYQKLRRPLVEKCQREPPIFIGVPSKIQKWRSAFELFAKKMIFKKQTSKCTFPLEKNVFEDLCRLGRKSFWLLFDINGSTFNEGMLEKRFLHFRSQ